MTERQTYWMVRKLDMRIFRPIPQDELVKKIEAGDIASNDELCPGTGYWFMLSEVDEVRKHLGDVRLTSLQKKDNGEDTSSTDEPCRATTTTAAATTSTAPATTAAPQPTTTVPPVVTTTAPPPPPETTTTAPGGIIP